MIHKIIIPLYLDEVAPRFDLATEVLIVMVSNDNKVEEKRTVVLPRSSAENLCHLIVTENINTLICGAIEDEFYQFLKWKKVAVFNAVAGTWSTVFENWLNNSLNPGDILSKRLIEGKHV